MLHRMIFAGAIFAGMAGVACGSDGGGTKTATGVVFEVQSSSLTQLDGFTLHTDDGKTLEFEIAPGADQLNPQNGFVPSHLREHALTATKVTIDYREDGSQLLAIRIEDVLP